MFSTLAFAATEVEVTAVKLESGVEVTWDYLSQYKGMDVWCAIYDTEGKMLAVKQADMIEGQACRINCKPETVATVKLFILGEQLDPAQDVQLPEHIHVWETVTVTKEPTFMEAGVGQCVCACGETGEMVAIPPVSTPEERMLVQRAWDEGLLQYFCEEIAEIDNLDELTRLDVAMLVAAYADLDVDNSDECTFSDCADLNSMERRMINAAVEGGFIRTYEDGGFHPDDVLTRSQFILILMNCVGNPECSWDETCTNVPQWNEYDANTLYNLGILGDDPNLRGNDYATGADALEWLLNAREWESSLEPTNLRFDMGGKWIYWDIEGTNVTNLRYMVSLWDEENGKWLPNWGVPGREGTLQGLCTRWTEEGTYTGIRVIPRLDSKNLWNSGVEVRDMSVTVTRNEQHGAVVELVKENDQPKALSVSGLTAGETVRVSVRDDEGIYNDAVEATVNADGTLYQEIDVDWDGPIWYAIESFGGYTLSDDGKGLSYTVTCHGEGVIDSDPAYEVTDIRFDMFMNEVPVMTYVAPADISDDVRVDLYVPNADGEWKRAMGSNQGYFWMDWLEPGVYDRFKLVSVVDEEIKAWVIVDDMQLTIRSGGVSSAQVTFEKTTDGGYDWEVINGQPNTCFSMEIVEMGSGSFRPTGCFDDSGFGNGSEHGSHAISHIENGTFVLHEYRDLTISDKSLTVSIWSTEEKTCLPMDPAYAATNLHFEQNSAGMLFLAWDAPAVAAGENVEYAFQFYRAGDNSSNDWSGQTDSTRLGLWKFGNTNYDRLYVQTIVDGVPKGEVMFEYNFLTITEGADPNVQLTYTMIAGGYEMELIGQPNTLYVMTYRNANGSIVTYSPVTDSNGVYTEEITDSRRIDRIENGYINVMTYGNVVNSGANCSYTSNATGWVPGSDYIASITNDPAYAVTNVRFDITGGGISLVFDEPQNVNGEIRYEFYMTETGTGRRYGRGDSEYIFLGSYDEGVYEDMILYTTVDGELKAWVELDGYCLNLEDNGDSDARAEFVFAGDSAYDAYECTVTGTPGMQFAIEMRNGSGSTNHFGVLDADGKWTSIEDGEHTVPRIEGGHCMVREYDQLNISADGKVCEAIYRDSIKLKCLREYGYVTGDIRPEVTSKGDTVDYVTFWNGEENIELQAKHQFAGLLAKGDFFSYRREVRDDGTYRLAEIKKGADITGLATAVNFAGVDQVKWLKVDGVQFNLAEDSVIYYVDTDLTVGVSSDNIVLGRNVKCFLDAQNEKITAIFVDVNE